MTSTGLLAVGISHRTAPVAVLERLALEPGSAARWLAELGSGDVIREAAAVSTCARTELYLVASDLERAEGMAQAALSRRAGAEVGTLRGPVMSLRGPAAVGHLFRVTAGLDSVAMGETEIQGQVKRAYEGSLLQGLTGPITNRLFRGALQAGKRVRSETGDGRPRPSVASLAVRLSADCVGELKGRRVVVIGAGENAEATGRALAGHQARPVFVAGRRYARALALGRRFGGAAAGFQELLAELREADVAFGCTSSQQPVVGRHELARVMDERRGRALVLIDTALPRDIDPAARDVPGVELYDIDDIKRETARDERTSDPAAGAGRIIGEEVRRFQEWFASLDVVPAISALRAHGEAAVNHVLDQNEARWETLSPADRERLRMVARAVASRLLHEPTMTLKRVAGSGASAVYVRAVNELLGAKPASSDACDRPARVGQAGPGAPIRSGRVRGRPAAESTGG
jgi:glutamyl-tRNA reductase